MCFCIRHVSLLQPLQVLEALQGVRRLSAHQNRNAAQRKVSAVQLMRLLPCNSPAIPESYHTGLQP